MALPHCVHALDTDALHPVSRRFRMRLDLVHGASEFVDSTADNGRAPGVSRIAICGR